MDQNKEDQKKGLLKQIRTFQGDVAEVLKKEKESLASIQQREHQKRESLGAKDIPRPDSSDNSKAKLFYLITGTIILFVVGIVGIWYAYNEFSSKFTVPIASAPENRFISVDTETELVVTETSRETFIKNLSLVASETVSGQSKHVLLVKKELEETTRPLLTNEFFEILETKAPGSLIRALEPLFMFGTLGESVFVIIKIASFENTFAGMLSWEKNLGQDFGPLLSTAPLLRDAPLESVFIDVTDRNKDIRVFKLEGQDVLLYSFYENNMLIITDKIETFRIIIDRLTREKLSR